MALYLIRYGEIGLKSPAVRRRFEMCLITNIEKAFIRDKAECKVSSDRGHIYVNAEDTKVAENILAHTFGIISFSPVEVVKSSMDTICDFLKEWSPKLLKKGQTFAIRARRTGRHDYSSQDVAVKAGDAVRLANKEKGVKVDLEDPDIEVYVEVRDRKAYIYSTRTAGPGGMPLGSQGKVVCIVSDETSNLACWLMMKRGCHPIVLPLGDAKGLNDLARWTPSGQLTIGPSLKVLDEDTLLDVIRFAHKKRALAVVLGEDERPFKKKEFPIFYPCIGLSNKKRAGHRYSRPELIRSMKG